MLIQSPNHRIAAVLQQVGLAMLALGLPTSPALLSIGAGVLAAGGILGALVGIPRHSLPGLLLPLLLLPIAWSGLYSEDSYAWWGHVRVQLPLAAVALVVLFPVTALQVRWRGWLGLFVGAVTMVAAYSLLHYLLHRTTLNALAAQNQALPILKLKQAAWALQTEGLSHIYFSVLNALAIPLAGLLWHHSSTRWRWLWAVCGVFLFGTIHLFAARTGLLALYAGAMVLALGLAFQRRKWWVLVAFVAGLALPVVAFQGSVSFRNRVQNSIEDWNNYRTGGDVSHWSLGRRLVVWEAGWALFKAHPHTGIGSGDLKPDLIAQQAALGYRYHPDFYLHDPHNQYLWLLVCTGWPGLLALFALLLAPAFYHRWRTEPAYWALLVFWGTAFLFESFLARQVGVVAFGLSWGGMLWLKSTPEP